MLTPLMHTRRGWWGRVREWWGKQPGDTRAGFPAALVLVVLVVLLTGWHFGWWV